MSNRPPHETLVPEDVDMDPGVIFAKYAIMLSKQLSKIDNYPDEIIPPALLSALSSGIRTILEIEKEKRAAAKEREELTEREKVTLIQGLLNETPQLAGKLVELLEREEEKDDEEL